MKDIVYFPWLTFSLLIGICRIAFLVDDIDTVYQELQAKQVEFVRPLQKLDGPRGTKIGVVCFKDPDGTVLELISSDIEASGMSAQYTLTHIHCVLGNTRRFQYQVRETLLKERCICQQTEN